MALLQQCFRDLGGFHPVSLPSLVAMWMGERGTMESPHLPLVTLAQKQHGISYIPVGGNAVTWQSQGMLGNVVFLHVQDVIMEW